MRPPVAGIPTVLAAFQENLWHRVRADGSVSNVFLTGDPALDYPHPKRGWTDSGDVGAKRREFRRMRRSLAPELLRPCVQWQKIHRDGAHTGAPNYADLQLQRYWPDLLAEELPEARWAIFYDPILAARQNLYGGAASGMERQWWRDECVALWRHHLRHFEDRYFGHPAYWHQDGRPVVYVWALHSVEGMEPLLRESGCFVLGDVFGRPPGLGPYGGVDVATGFVSVLPGMRGTLDPSRVLRTIRSEADRWRSLGYPVMGAGSLQYDDTRFRAATDRGQATVMTNRSQRDLDRFARGLVEATDWLATWFGTWNNWPEGTTLLPTKRSIPGVRPAFPAGRVGWYGNRHLRAVRRAIG